ncbi:MAG: inorganic pyrophosphatase [Pyrinomonadaceae bacterium]|jgi:inorganic pyrophosphatase|nr:inorganic pyrophosphatase [Pyrinomonadaceae bacterium]
MPTNDEALHDLLAKLFQAHPWHGVVPGADSPAAVNAYIEIVPTDAVKYELDKPSGHLRVDRPQRFSSMCPTPYGFIPQTYCGASVAALCEARVGRTGIRGDGDPLDICVLTERPAAHGDFFVRALPIGGLRMIDGNEADDKIIAVLESDVTYGHLRDIADAPRGLVDRLQHYFLSYKQLPQEAPRRVEIAEVYNRADAAEVIERSVADYRATYGAPETRIAELRRLLMSGA